MTIWLHGASVGEVLLARILIKELVKILPEADFVLSTMTEQGMEIARKQADVKVRCIYAPLDLAGMVDRSIQKDSACAVYMSGNGIMASFYYGSQESLA